MSFTALPRTLRGTALLAAALWLLPNATVSAQEFPSRTITLVVPYPPGSATDLVARMFQPRLAEALRQSVVVENRGGASTNIGTEYVARSAPDGHTLLIQAPNIATNEFAFSNLRWRREDFAPVGTLVRWSNVLVAGPSAPEKDVRKLLAMGKGHALNYGSPGPGSLSHLAMESLATRSSLGIDHVTFAGPGPMIISLLGGHIQYGATNPSNFMPHVADGKQRLAPLVVLGSQRDPTIPEVPALGEFGITGIESHGWLGVLVPAKTPAGVVSRLNTEFMKILNTPEIAEKLRAAYLEPFGGTPEEFARFMVSENRKWGEAIRAAGIKPAQ
jgi:tripartite-type tricarboxylate transporter receptor subunit TctC